MLLSIVVPVYKEEKNVPEFLRRIQPILEQVTQDYEIIFALDPSPDRTQEVVLEHRKADPRIKLLTFSRRFGQPMATIAGLQYSRGEAVIVMDVDLQDPPDLVTGMIDKWREGFDVVYAQRKDRKGETWIKILIASTGYRIINRIADVNIPPNTGDFRLMSRRVVDEVCRLKECHGFLRGMVALVGFRQTSIMFDRPARFSGEGNYNRFLGSLRIGFNGIFCFSNAALTLSTMMGFVIAGLSFLLMFIYLGMKALEWWHVITPTYYWGTPALMILVSFLGGVQLISIGILGEYVGRIYEEVKQRPKFIVDHGYGFEPGVASSHGSTITSMSPATAASSAVVHPAVVP
ncbi:MAG: glycosyltransferase family 2 protein [Candidatus Methylacidiphilales bacterium]|nr:glycosyltransferase family 2 protein [Candidatus Methylacidiphilales bacterium]